MTTVTVIIPTYNRLERLRQVLQALEKQTYSFDDFEVVVVSDGSSDGTQEYLQSYTPPFLFKPVCQENQGVAVARNHGVSVASGRYLLFVDDDVVPSSTLISEHMKIHHSHNDVIVIGPMLTPEEFDMLPWVLYEQAMLVKQYEAMVAGAWEPTARQFYTGNTSLLRKHVVEAGGFDPSFRRAEDLELAYRLADKGLRFFYHPGAVGYHYAERSFASWLAIPYAYGRNDVIFTFHKGQKWLLPLLYQEFWNRHLLIRGLTWLCLDHPRLSKFIISILKHFIEIGFKYNMASLTTMICSGIFNLQYYQGLTDELGGRKTFFTAVIQARQRVLPLPVPPNRESPITSSKEL